MSLVSSQVTAAISRREGDGSPLTCNVDTDEIFRLEVTPYLQDEFDTSSVCRRWTLLGNSAKN